MEQYSEIISFTHFSFLLLDFNLMCVIKTWCKKTLYLLIVVFATILYQWNIITEQVPASSQNSNIDYYFYRGDCNGFLFMAQMVECMKHAPRAKDSPTCWGVRQTHLHTLWVFDASWNSSLAHKYLKRRVHENQHFCYIKLTCVLLLFCMVN